jgi:hypothetical protein
MNRGCRSLEEVLAGPVEINRDSPQATGLVVDYPGFASRGMNKLRDLGGRGLDGSFVGSPVWVASSKLGAALSLNGTSDYVSVPDSSSLEGFSQMTVWAWIYPTAVVGSGLIASKPVFAEGAVIVDPYQLWTISRITNTVSWGVSTGGAGSRKLVTSAATIQANQVYHVCGTYDGQTLRVYINGVVDVNTTATTLTVGTNAITARIGALVGSGVNFYGFTGQIGACGVNGIALSPSVICQMAQRDTMWDLYRPVARFWPGVTLGSVAISPDLASVGGPVGVSVEGMGR